MMPLILMRIAGRTSARVLGLHGKCKVCSGGSAGIGLQDFDNEKQGVKNYGTNSRS